jgi:general stress protein 26
MDTSETLLDVARRLLAAAPCGFFVTAEPQGPPSGRLVQHLEVTDDLTVTFSTSPTTRKAERAAATGTATYLVEDRDCLAYVSLSGQARLDDDLELRRRLWYEGLRDFFPEGPEGSDFVLVVLSTDRVELVSIADKIHPDPYGLVPAVLVRDHDAWQQVHAGQ